MFRRTNAVLAEEIYQCKPKAYLRYCELSKKYRGQLSSLEFAELAFLKNNIRNHIPKLYNIIVLKDDIKGQELNSDSIQVEDMHLFVKNVYEEEEKIIIQGSFWRDIPKLNFSSGGSFEFDNGRFAWLEDCRFRERLKMSDEDFEKNIIDIPIANVNLNENTNQRRLV
ncbi:MAG: hypothetical protein P4M12_11960 [Gammaproteobacteria bacterium]|nr:hypothetical protein [Gammaproteobacteria bacterium]